MKPPGDSRPAEFDVRMSDQAKRRKHRKDTSAFLWGTWLLLLAVFLGRDTLQGFRDGEWVDISSDNGGLLVPWWLAAVLVFGALALSLWCFREYVKLKDTAPKYQPGDETDNDE